MKITELFPKPKRVVGYNPNTGNRTAFALKKEGAWQEMMADIEQCTSLYQLQKCRFVWAEKVVADLWPQDWIDVAIEEFDKAVESVALREQSE